MTTIVVGIDLSDQSRAALRWACGVAAEGDHVIAVHAWDMPVYLGYEGMVAVEPGDLEQGAVTALEQLSEADGMSGVERRVVRGHPGRAVVEAAAGADMAVVGHRGTSKASLVLGSVANYVMHHTDVPVVVVRGEREGPPRTVAVGVDDHAADEEDGPSVRALRWAYQLPGVERVEVRHAWFVPAVVLGRMSTATVDSTDMDRAAEELIRCAIDAAGPAPDGVEVVPVVDRGTGGFAMIEASREADLVVVGSRGHGGFAELILGSTTLEITAHSHCPVAVIR